MITLINAKTINEAWNELLFRIMATDEGGEYINAYKTGTIQRGSFVYGQSRLQLPGVAVSIEYPLIDRIATVPEGSGLPAPTTLEQVNRYFEEYLIGTKVPVGTVYTYGERIDLSLNRVIQMLIDTPVTNQAVIEVGRPEDIELSDPPCLRSIDFKAVPQPDGQFHLNMSVYFRSWDLYAGMPQNLGGLSFLLEYVALATGMQVGKMYAYSAGLHLYSYQRGVVEARVRRVTSGF